MQWKRLVKALGLTLKDQAFDIVNALLLPSLRSNLHEAFPVPNRTAWLSENLWSDKTIDGAVIAGIAPRNAYAKFALPKGLPTAQKPTLAIENDPHTLDGFSGVIEDGYGKGIKSLLYRDEAVLKVRGRTLPALVEYHFHEAEKAGPHFDLCVQHLPQGTGKFEINIPKGEFKGRYAFNQTSRGMIITRMIDRGIVHPKPAYQLKPEEILTKIGQENQQVMEDRTTPSPLPWMIERKVDGSLANVLIHERRAIFRSHRPAGETYYDRLPALEFLDNKSCSYLCRMFFPGPDLDGTMLKVELLHPDGVPRVSGILNALPSRAREIQQLRGPVTLQAWDIIQLKGRNVSKLPYHERRQLYEQAVREIRRFNPHWDVVQLCPEGTDPYEFYKEVIQNPLPFGEGVVIKDSQKAHGEETWLKVKKRDFHDFEVIDIQEGTGKYAGTVGRFVVRNPENDARGEIGSFAITDQQRQWIWDHRGELQHAVAKCLVMDVTARGAPRAGVFISWHEGKGPTEAGLRMYAESLAGGDPKLTDDTVYALKSAAGWRSKR